MIVAGFGFRKSATLASLIDAMERAGGGVMPDCIASVTDKADSDLFARLAQTCGRPIARVCAADLAQQQTLTQSAASMRARQSGSVAEAAALAAGGARAKLLGARCVSQDGLATCAFAEGDGT